MAENGNNSFGPQPDYLLMQQMQHKIGDEMAKIINTPQFDNNRILTVLQQINTQLTQINTQFTQLNIQLTPFNIQQQAR